MFSYFLGRRGHRLRPVKSISKSKQKIIYEIPHDDSKGDVIPLTPMEVDGLKNNNEIHLSQIIEINSILTKLTKLPNELILVILQYAVLSHASFSAETDETMFGRRFFLNHEYLSLSIPSSHALDFPPGITVSKKCSELIVECSSHDQGWSSQNNQHNGTYIDSYTWSEVAILKNKENEEDKFEEFDRTKIGNNIRVDQSFRHHMKRFYEVDGFVKNVELGDKVTIFLRSEYGGWQNTANYASITAKYPIVFDALVMP